MQKPANRSESSRSGADSVAATLAIPGAEVLRGRVAYHTLKLEGAGGRAGRRSKAFWSDAS
jgi:hypothetical protein